MSRCKYSDDDLIRIIQDKAKELGRVPRRRDVKQFDVIAKRFGSWNNALIKAGFTPSWKTKEYSREDYIKMIRTKAKELGRTPYAREWDEDKRFPGIDKTRKDFGNITWNEILEIAGLEPIYTYLGYEEEHVFNQMSDDEVLQRVKNELDRLNTSSLGVYDLNKNKDMPTSRFLLKRLKANSWNDILLRLGYSKDELTIKEYSDEELIKALQDYYKETGLNPSISTMEGRGYNHKTFTAHFGSFNNALLKAGLEINLEQTTVTHADNELLQMYKDLCKRLGRAATTSDIEAYLPYKPHVFAIRFGGIQNLRELAGYPSGKRQVKKYTKKEIGNKLIEQYKKYNRRLTNAEISKLSKEQEDFPALSTILRYFQTTKMSEVWNDIEKEIQTKS